MTIVENFKFLILSIIVKPRKKRARALKELASVVRIGSMREGRVCLSKKLAATPITVMKTIGFEITHQNVVLSKFNLENLSEFSSVSLFFV